MMHKEMAAMSKGETRDQHIYRLMREGQCGLLPLDLSCPCPKRGGPDRPHPAHPGKVGFLTCQGCEHQTGLHFDNRVCTHPQARQVAARWLAEAIRTWEEQHAQTATTLPREPGEATRPQAALPPSSPDPPRKEGPTQLTMRFA
jgi:hypothetical protein